MQKVVSTCRPWFGSNDTNDSWKIFELDLQQAITERDAADKEEAAENGGIENKQIDGLVAEDGEILAYTILRGTLQRIMQTELSKEHDIYIQFDKRLCDISNKEGEGITCQFTDGTQTSGYDLIIGCDGIQSAVRQYVNNGSIQAKKKEAAIYSGLRITFAIQEDAIDADEVCTFTQHFGNGAYALTSTYGAGKDESRAKGAFLVYPDENYIGPFKRQKPAEEDSIGTSKTTSIDEAKPLDENVDWTQNKRIPKDKIQECLKILQTSSIPGNDVANIVGKADRFFDLGVYFYNPFTFNGWVREIKASNSKDDNPKFAVLTGDAAHAMPPFLGQGANQAMQDSCVLAAKIFEYNSQVSSTSSSEADLKALLKEYENRRWLPTTSITVKAALLGYLEVGPSLFSNFRDVFFLVMVSRLSLINVLFYLFLISRVYSHPHVYILLLRGKLELLKRYSWTQHFQRCNMKSASKNNRHRYLPVGILNTFRVYATYAL